MTKKVIARIAIISSTVSALLLSGGASRIWR